MKTAFRAKPGKKFVHDSGRPAGKPLSFKSTCAECGAACSVPFRPNGKKPVLCAACFKKDGRMPATKPWERKPWEKRVAKDERAMHAAECSRCGAACEVPFRPVSGRPIYCASCLGHGDKKTPSQAPARIEEQFKVLNAKLDEILAALKSSAS